MAQWRTMTTWTQNKQQVKPPDSSDTLEEKSEDVQPAKPSKRQPAETDSKDGQTESPSLTLEEKIKLTELTPEKAKKALKNEIVQQILKGCTFNESTGCLDWQKGRSAAGYGQINYGGSVKYTHRSLFMAYHGVNLTSREHVCHHCDRPSCCNIVHLFLGSATDNMQDMYRKGRDAYSRGVANNPLGERCHLAKITDAQEAEIRSLLKQGFGATSIFKTGKFPISISGISKIKTGKSRRLNLTTPTNQNHK